MSENMNTLYEVCGNIGFKHLLIRCRVCKFSAVHQYCMDKVVFDASLAHWLCYECHGKHGEATFSISLEKMSSERQPSNSQERNMDYTDILRSSQHHRAESSERNVILECQKGSSCQNGKDVNMSATFLSSQESGDDILSENKSLESDDVQALPAADYVLSRTSHLSKAQKKRAIAFIRKSKLETTVFVAVMRKSNVQPPMCNPQALVCTNVTLQRPGKRKKWHPIFYKKNESRKNMLMGAWLDFVCDNHVHEGDICLLAPGKSEEKSIFMVYLLHATSAHSRAGSVSVSKRPGGSTAKTSSEVHMEEPSDEQHISTESGKPESPDRSMEGKVAGGLSLPPFILPQRSRLSKSQKRIVEEGVVTIKSKVPICVAIMKNNNVGVAQRWMLELGSRFASVHLPAKGETVVLQCGRKIWETKMMYHTGRRWTLNGGWPQFVRDNGLRVGDICLFELKKGERKLTMRVHIISRE